MKRRKFAFASGQSLILSSPLIDFLVHLLGTFDTSIVEKVRNERASWSAIELKGDGVANFPSISVWWMWRCAPGQNNEHWVQGRRILSAVWSDR